MVGLRSDGWGIRALKYDRPNSLGTSYENDSFLEVESVAIRTVERRYMNKHW